MKSNPNGTNKEIWNTRPWLQFELNRRNIGQTGNQGALSARLQAVDDDYAAQIAEVARIAGELPDTDEVAERKQQELAQKAKEVCTHIQLNIPKPIPVERTIDIKY
jgi:hypothetical protein